MIGSVVAPIPSSAEATTDPAPSSAAASPTKVTPSTTPTAATTPSAVGALRTSYPGIKKLVIVRSRWNNTPAGRKAIETVAAYNSALVTATVVKSVEPARRLSSLQCLQCQDDINRISGYVRAGQQVITYTDATPYSILASTIFVSSIDGGGRATVVFTSSNPAVKLTAADGRVVGTQKSSYEVDQETVDTRDDNPRVEQIEFQ